MDLFCCSRNLPVVRCAQQERFFPSRRPDRRDAAGVAVERVIERQCPRVPHLDPVFPVGGDRFKENKPSGKAGNGGGCTRVRGYGAVSCPIRAVREHRTAPCGTGSELQHNSQAAECPDHADYSTVVIEDRESVRV